MISRCPSRLPSGYQLDGNGDSEPGVLMTAQTITSESLCTTTTTHITKVHAHVTDISTPLLSNCLRLSATRPAVPQRCCGVFLLQTLKGGLSETRIEKRIVITGDCDIDHDQVGIRRAASFSPGREHFC